MPLIQETEVSRGTRADLTSFLKVVGIHRAQLGLLGDIYYRG